MISLEQTRASSLISCGKTGEEELSSGTQTLTCHQVLSWAGSPGATMGVCPAETSFRPLGARHGKSVHRARDTCVSACAQLLWVGR